MGWGGGGESKAQGELRQEGLGGESQGGWGTG